MLAAIKAHFLHSNIMLATLKAHFLHSRTMFVARMYTYMGVLVTAYDGVNMYLQTADFTPLSTRALDFVGVPPDLRGLAVTVFVAGTGLLFAKLRKLTKTPLMTGEPSA